MEQPRIQYCKTADGVSIAYYVIGEGLPLIYLSGYWNSHLSMQWASPWFRSVTESLAASSTAVRYDGRGSGLSQREPADFSLDARLLDLEAVVDRTGFANFALLGGGHGALTAVAYAARHGDRVSRLILRNPYPRGAELYEVSPIMKLVAALGEVSAEQWEFVTMTMAQRATGDQEQAEELAALSRASMTPEALLAFREATKRIDVTPLLSQIVVPTLVIHVPGEFTPLSFSQECAASVPQAQLHMSDSGWSLGNLTEQDAVVMRTFLGASAAAVSLSLPSPAGRYQIQTILFTDVEGSTALTQRLGDAAAREVLREHERITREALKAHGGSEVKTMGDGFMTSFGSATKAVECAVAIQRAFEGNRQAEIGDREAIRVRIGLNAGEPIAEDDPDGRGDLHGTAVIVAARIAAQAHGGEILVSDVVRQLVAGKGFLFNDRGDHALKGFEDPVRVYEVRWSEGG